MGLFGPNTIKRGARVYEEVGIFNTREEAQIAVNDMKAMKQSYVLEPKGNPIRWHLYAFVAVIEPTGQEQMG
jgi:hypothetical protein